VIGLGMGGPVVISHGTEEQKHRYLPPLLSADEIWCQGFSEPDAGSDLAAVRTRAERKGDVYVVNGQKVWSSFAHIADFCILVTQSDPEAPRYKNLTYLIVDMHAPGVEVRQLRQITGEAEFNEILFSDVEVPVEDRPDEEGRGWQVALKTTLQHRAPTGFALPSTPAGRVGQKDARHAGRQPARDREQGHLTPRSDRAFDLEPVAAKVVVALERPDQQVVGRHPNRAAPETIYAIRRLLF